MPDYKKELEEFTYLVSHDLNAPLRHIKSFGDLLMDSLEDKVTDQEREYFDYMKRGISKAEAMLGAMLQLSRISTQSNAFQLFNCDNLVRDVIAHDIDSSHATITVSNMPEAMSGDKNQIRHLFFYLLDNALKFSKPEIPPVISITADLKDDMWHFSITDNGIGIEEDLQEAVFQMFRTLNGDEYPGLGCGLAYAKKIVEHHGGEIAIHTHSDQTLEIQFSIPKAHN